MQDSLVSPRPRRSGPRARGAESRPATEATCSVRVILPFARYLTKLGCNIETWLAGHGLTQAMLSDRDLRVPHHKATAMLDDAVVLCGDPAIALHAARCDEP